MLAGFVAGEGSFVVTVRNPPRRDGSLRLRFVFQVSVAARDAALLEDLRDLLGYGSLHSRPPGMPHHQPQTVFTINSIDAHLAATIPWADACLLPSAKRTQYQLWRDALIVYRSEHGPRSRSRCSEPECEDYVRGRGLCRRHYYRATGY